MDTWTLQMGYPVINVKREGQLLTVSQKRFLSSSSSTEDQDQYKWWVPITFDFENSAFNRTSSSFWLSPDQNELTITLPQEQIANAVIVNVQQTGYYRVNYDEDNWNQIAAALTTNPYSIHRSNRGQIFNDLFSLAKVNLVPYRLALETTKSLLIDDDYIPWKSALNSFTYIRLMLRRSAAYGMFKRSELCYINTKRLPLTDFFTYFADT